MLQAQYESELKGKTNSEIVIDIVLKANQFLFEIMPDIQSSKDLEIQMANLIPIFIENLGSPKVSSNSCAFSPHKFNFFHCTGRRPEVNAQVHRHLR